MPGQLIPDLKAVEHLCLTSILKGNAIFFVRNSTVRRVLSIEFTFVSLNFLQIP